MNPEISNKPETWQNQSEKILLMCLIKSIILNMLIYFVIGSHLESRKEYGAQLNRSPFPCYNFCLTESKGGKEGGQKIAFSASFLKLFLAS